MARSSTEPGGTPVPRLSVIVASTNAGGLLRRCLDALLAQAGQVPMEIIVARDAGRFDDVERGREAANQVRWIQAPPGSTVPQLRGLGMAAARADLVAVLEDDCVVESGWADAAAAANGEAAAVGGAVEPGAYVTLLDWAVYFCEYGRFMHPAPSGPGAPLTGNNVVYRREALASLPEAVRADFRETFVHTGWHDAGTPTRVNNAMIVRNVNAWSLRHVTSVPFHHGRAYAATRFGPRGPGVRMAVALMTVAMPAVKLLRVLRGTLERRRLVGRMAAAVPWMLVFLGSWSAGEIVGCLTGPGHSASRWR